MSDRFAARNGFGKFVLIVEPDRRKGRSREMADARIAMVRAARDEYDLVVQIHKRACEMAADKSSPACDCDSHSFKRR